jgi:hypothetical protein
MFPALIAVQVQTICHNDDDKTWVNIICGGELALLGQARAVQ